MNIVIVGAGAMGCLYAGMLARAGREVWLLERSRAHAEAIRAHGLTIEEQGPSSWHVDFDAITSDPAAVGTADVVILFVKAYDTESAIRAVAPAVAQHTTVITLQNGIGNVEHIRRYTADAQIVAGTTAHGAHVISEGHVRHAGTGETVLGPLVAAEQGRARAIKELFEQAGIRTALTENVDSVVWGKLIVNIGINALTAIMRIRNGQILDYPPLREVMRTAVDEGVAVAERLGIALPYSDPLRKVEDVCRATAENISSMHQDIRAGRKTEIGQINGAVAELGRTLEVPTPANRMLTGLVQSIEQIQQK